MNELIKKIIEFTKENNKPPRFLLITKDIYDYMKLNCAMNDYFSIRFIKGEYFSSYYGVEIAILCNGQNRVELV